MLLSLTGYSPTLTYGTIRFMRINRRKSLQNTQASNLDDFYASFSNGSRKATIEHRHGSGWLVRLSQSTQYMIPYTTRHASTEDILEALDTATMIASRYVSLSRASFEAFIEHEELNLSEW